MLSEEDCKQIFKMEERIVAFYFFKDIEIEKEGSSVIVTNKKVFILDEWCKVISKYTGLHITGALQIGPYLYTINNVMHNITQEHFDDERETWNDKEPIKGLDREKSFSAINLK